MPAPPPPPEAMFTVRQPCDQVPSPPLRPRTEEVRGRFTRCSPCELSQRHYKRVIDGCASKPFRCFEGQLLIGFPWLC